MRFLIFLLGLVPISGAWAYPDFIGYGYTTCTVCHFNSQGGGALTDYGRALFSQEIAARPWVQKSLSDEELATLSSFIPGVELPYWVRPSIKYRGLYVESAPRSAHMNAMWIDMQSEVGLTFSWDRMYKTIFSATYGSLPHKRDYYGNGKEVSSISREHYIRTYIGKNFLIAVGLMDKVFGLRTVDHTAYSRRGIGFGQDNQAHGIVLEWLQPNFDFALNYFQGNLMAQEDLRQKGVSFLSEYEIYDKNRLGLSAAKFENTKGINMNLVALHHRMGFEKVKGASLIAEIGMVDKDNTLTSKRTQGSYGYLQGLVPLTRGYNIISALERSQEENRPSSLDRQRWTFGFLTFPFQRVEVRTTLVQQKGFTEQGGEADTWQFQGQVHVAL